MKKVYIIINGKKVVTIHRNTMSDAIEYAQNYCNHSSEIIVREIETLRITKSGLAGHQLINLN